MFAYLATFFTFGALVLEVFNLLGSTFNQPFLKSLYFVQYSLNDNFINIGLWGYCEGTTKSGITYCSPTTSAFIWSNVPGIETYTAGLSGMDKVYLANYILILIALAITASALAITLLDHFGRPADFYASIATFLGFLVMLATFVILLVVCIRSVNAAKESGKVGDCVYMHLAAMVALLLGSLWYCFTCVCGRPRKHHHHV
ncbi:actin cortical patch SUR7/pH-response regulator pali [Chlamydoabsidia padenii]|nr:actin cortical patch SUR7/pH-response regulator pali [Chlamydoabsidia padenii]